MTGVQEASACGPSVGVLWSRWQPIYNSLRQSRDLRGARADSGWGPLDAGLGDLPVPKLQAAESPLDTHSPRDGKASVVTAGGTGH